jgi:hypothetical protein
VTAFEALLWTNVLLALVALARLRAATLIFAGNQIVVLRAFANIEAYGPPASQAFLPPSLFGTQQLELAAAIFSVATVLLAVAVALPAARKVPLRADALPAVPRWLLWLLALFFAVLAASSRTVFTAEYADPARTVFEFHPGGGVQALAGSVLLYELFRRVLSGRLRPALAFAVLLAVFAATDYLKGSTGLASGFAVCGAVLLLGGAIDQPGRRLLSVGAALLIALFASATVRGVRASMHEQGAQAVTAFFDAVVDSEQGRAARGEGAERETNASQYAAHVLECVALYEAGLSREWRSIWLPLEYTVKPVFVMVLFGVERSREAAVELRDHFVHGGGIYLLGELYWNGGYLCVLLVTAALLAFAWLCDTRARTSLSWLVMFCAFAPVLVQGVGYGFAQISRGAINGALLLAAGAAWMRVRRARAERAAALLAVRP